MKLLLDTQLLLWAASEPERLSPSARRRLDDPENDLIFSAASIWEITIKNAIGRDDFRVEPRVLRRGLLDNGYTELPVTSELPSMSTRCPPFTKIHSTGFSSLRLSSKESRCSPPTRISRGIAARCARSEVALTAAQT